MTIGFYVKAGLYALALLAAAPANAEMIFCTIYNQQACQLNLPCAPIKQQLTVIIDPEGGNYSRCTPEDGCTKSEAQFLKVGSYLMTSFMRGNAHYHARLSVPEYRFLEMVAFGPQWAGVSIGQCRAQ